MSSSATATTLSGCVTSLRHSMQLLESSIAILDTGVSDLPRLSTALQTTRHFALVSEPSLSAAQAALTAEIAPEIGALLARVGAYLDGLERRERQLIAKAELQEGRLGRRTVSTGGGKDREKAGTGEVLTGLQTVKAQQLRQKKERLSYAVGRLELQAGQRERQLRKSVYMGE